MIRARLRHAGAVLFAGATLVALGTEAQTSKPDLSVGIHLRGDGQFPDVWLKNSGGALQKGFTLQYFTPMGRLDSTVSSTSAIYQALNGTTRVALFRPSSWASLGAGQEARVVVDGFNVIDEANEANNEAVARHGDECKPALGWPVTPADLALSIAKVPGHAALAVTIKNLGAPRVGEGFGIRIVHQPSYKVIFKSGAETTHLLALAKAKELDSALRQTQFELGFQYNPNVQYTLRVKADRECRITESSESNNEVSLVINPGMAPECLKNPDAVCAANPGLGVCTPSQKSCAGSGWVRLCAANGHSWTEVRCPATTTCQAGECK